MEPHIRPKVRSRKTSVETKPKKENAGDNNDLDAMLEETRQRVESWLSPPSANNVSGSVGTEKELPHNDTDANGTKNEKAVVADSDRQTTGSQQKAPSKTGGILRTPKYSKPAAAPLQAEKIMPGPSGSQQKPLESAAIKDTVVERDPSLQARPTSRSKPDSKQSALFVEGYAPKLGPESCSSTSPEEKSEPLVFSSMSELLGAAGKLPADDASADEDPKVIEADISFSCMTAEEYQAMGSKEEESPEHDKENGSVEGEDTDTDSGYDSGEGTDEDDLLDFLQGSEDSEDEAMPEPEPRAFLELWTVLSTWITPEAVELVQHWRSGSEESQPQESVVQSDMGASRCAGLMAILKMHLSRSLQELQRPIESKRQTEKRLNDFLRALDYSQPMAKLDTKLWRAMCCILLEIVLYEETEGIDPALITNIPASVKTVGMTKDEYRYLTRSAVTSLGEASENSS
jgi:hypothetical protein